MGLWRCVNEECPDCCEEITVPIEKIVVVDGEVRSDAKQCPTCKQDREELGKSGPARISLHGHNLSNS